MNTKLALIGVGMRKYICRHFKMHRQLLKAHAETGNRYLCRENLNRETLGQGVGDLLYF